MKDYKLTSKEGEQINKTQANSLELAIEFFTKTKNLKEEELLKIYKVKEC
jgi:hypothetical protein